MYHDYCESICNLFDKNQPKVICRSIISYSYTTLLLTMYYRPTKQTKNVKAPGFMKADNFRETWCPDLAFAASYLLDYDLEMAFCAYQVLAYAHQEDFIKFLQKNELRSRSDRYKEIFDKFIEWSKEEHAD